MMGAAAREPESFRILAAASEVAVFNTLAVNAFFRAASAGLCAGYFA
jgi:hypothetical protein